MRKSKVPASPPAQVQTQLESFWSEHTYSQGPARPKVPANEAAQLCWFHAKWANNRAHFTSVMVICQKLTIGEAHYLWSFIRPAQIELTK
jgi:hypothetical protein